MSTITSTIAQPVKGSAPRTPDRIFTVDREQFARDYNKRPFSLQHNLSSQPAFTMDRLHALLERSLPIKDKVYWNAGPKRIDQRWSDQPGRDFSIEEAFRRIRECDAWIIIFGAERDPEIHDFLERGLAEVQELGGISLAKEAKTHQSILFITSPHRITNYHIDCECSLLLQIYGKKTIHIFDQTDREVLTELELERFWTVDTNAAIYKEALQHRAMSYLLEPGMAVHIPTNAPHWLQNGDDISVSVNQNFQYRNERLANIYRANYYLRKMGVNPLPPGHSVLKDRFKGESMVVPVALGKQLQDFKKRFEKK